MDITALKISKVDIDQSEIEHFERENFGAHFERYLAGLIDLIIRGSSSRKFRFDRDTTEVSSQLLSLYEKGVFDNIAGSVATRLLDCEKNAQTGIARMGGQIQKGILIQTIINYEGMRKYIICKADHSDFLDENSFEERKGLPLKKKVFKAFVCSLLDNGTLDGALVYDTNATLSVYWWKYFLELTQLRSDEFNTESAFEAIDKGVLYGIKKKHPKDHVALRNATIHYFRSNDRFDITEYVETVFENYTPYDETMNKDSIISKVTSLPTTNKNQFDGQFPIVKEKITARFKNTIVLTDQIDLVIKEDVPNIDSIITAERDKDGTAYVKIITEKAFVYFPATKNDSE